MPYEWTHSDTQTVLEAWPYRSLPKKGFVIVIGIAVCLLALPAIVLVGSVVLWVLLPFMALAVTSIWWGLQKSYRDGEILEHLSITRDDIHLTRHERGKAPKEWTCNTYWATAHMHETKGPVPYYVTLNGNSREVEVGAFLSEDERRQLYSDLLDALRKAK